MRRLLLPWLSRTDANSTTRSFCAAALLSKSHANVVLPGKRGLKGNPNKTNVLIKLFAIVWDTAHILAYCPWCPLGLAAARLLAWRKTTMDRRSPAPASDGQWKHQSKLDDVKIKRLKSKKMCKVRNTQWGREGRKRGAKEEEEKNQEKRRRRK